MIAEKERNEVLVTLAQTQNEELFQQIAPPGYTAGAGFWMADDFDEPLEEMMPYMY